jgi:hypothetical protein
LPITLTTGWIYCDQLTSQPAITRTGKLSIMAEKPSALQLVRYSTRDYQRKQPVIAKKIAVIVPDKH